MASWKRITSFLRHRVCFGEPGHDFLCRLEGEHELAHLICPNIEK